MAFRFYDGSTYSMSDGKFIVGGNITLDGDGSTQLEILDLDFEWNGTTAVVNYCDVKNSVVTGSGGDIDASANTNLDDGGNTGWSFDIVIITSVTVPLIVRKQNSFGILLVRNTL